MLTSYEVDRHEFAGAKVLIILRILTLLENIITYFHFRVYQIFVSSLFLVLVYSNKLYCVSITYEELTGFQEEYHDGGATVSSCLPAGTPSSTNTPFYLEATLHLTDLLYIPQPVFFFVPSQLVSSPLEPPHQYRYRLCRRRQEVNSPSNPWRPSSHHRVVWYGKR